MKVSGYVHLVCETYVDPLKQVIFTLSEDMHVQIQIQIQNIYFM